MLNEIKAQPGPQTILEISNAFEIFMGGAAGVGKSFALAKKAFGTPINKDGRMLVDNPNYRCIIFRKTTAQLAYLKELFDKLVPKVFPTARSYNRGECKVWVFESGAQIKLWHMQQPEAFRAHDGYEYTVVMFDELTHFREEEYLYLFTRVRTTDPELVPFLQVVSTGMPEGPFCAWVKKRFIDQGPNLIKTVVIKIAGKVFKYTRQWIAGTLDDNQILMRENPQYETNLAIAGEERYYRLRFGDWSKPKGAFFGDLAQHIHMIPSWKPGLNQSSWVTLDWGSAKPFSLGWYNRDHDGVIRRFREWYGGEPGSDTGQDIPVKAVAAGIKERSSDLTVVRYVGDPAIWIKNAEDVPSIGEMFYKEGIYFEKAHNDRINGWMNVKNRISTYGGQKPTAYVTADCRAFWQIVPGLPHDKNRYEDLDTKSEDHIADEWRYSLMEYPIIQGSLTDIHVGSTLTSLGM